MQTDLHISISIYLKMLSNFCVESLKCKYEYDVITGLQPSTYINKRKHKKTFSKLEEKAILKSLSKHSGEF